jgi:hypothetical protein
VNTFEQAILRMKALDAACTELIAMAREDITKLEKRRQNARTLISAWEKLAVPPPLREIDIALYLEWSPEELEMERKVQASMRALYENAEAQAKEIAGREPQTVGCMGVGMKY